MGIDPGLSGAIAILKDHEVMTFPMPLRSEKKMRYRMTTRQVNKKKIKKRKLIEVRQNYIDEGALWELLYDHLGDLKLYPFVYLEQVHAMPNQGVSSMFNFGMTYGIIRGVLCSHGFKIVDVRPTEWQTYLKVPKGKAGSIAKASELMPDSASEWQKDDGRAEAALIAHYGWRIENKKRPE